MSNSPETGLDLEDLELQLLPAWARQSPDTNRFAKYEGGERRIDVLEFLAITRALGAEPTRLLKALIRRMT